LAEVAGVVFTSPSRKVCTPLIIDTARS
jgi:hypothetical protein